MSKTGYTRGASKREIYQNRVYRNNTVLIRRESWDLCRNPGDGTLGYENGYIVLIEPSWYFDDDESDNWLLSQGLSLGLNALLFFERRADWTRWRHEKLRGGKPLEVATSRLSPLGGNYFARIHATIADDGVDLGFATTALRGAGIRVYEYASARTIEQVKTQLEALFWHTYDADEVMVACGMTENDVRTRRSATLEKAEAEGLLDHNRLRNLRILDRHNETCCPLCRKKMSLSAFISRGEQAIGREIYDITVTEASLFHIQELRVGSLQHRTYNLGWGHHFCNVVVKDAGINNTLSWMSDTLANQREGSSEECDCAR